MNIENVTDSTKRLAVNIADMIREESDKEANFLVAIDGRCASGKTTLARELQEILSCDVIHMDHFFLRPEQRTRERLNTPGENVDHERFLEEVLIPLRKNEAVSYRPFDCKTMELGEPILLSDSKIYIIEGAYSCHEALWGYYDFRIFLSVSPKEQIQRIMLRNGEDSAEIFRSKWIPLEERYFEAFHVADKCNYCFTT